MPNRGFGRSEAGLLVWQTKMIGFLRREVPMSRGWGAWRSSVGVVLWRRPLLWRSVLRN